MTSSRSKVSRSNVCVLAILVVLVALSGIANAGRKRVVILDLEGPKAEKFQSDLVKIIKKSHTVVSADKWSDKGGDANPSKDNLKKTAKKLKVDGVVTGVVEKRRGQYILRVKLHGGASGKVVGSPVFKADGAKIDSDLAGDVKTELVELIDGLDSVRAGGRDDEEEDEKPKKGKKGDDDEAEEDEKPKKGGFTKKSKAEDDDEDDKPKKKTAKKGKKSNDDDEPKQGSDDEGTEEDPLPKKKSRPKADEDDGDDVASSDGDDDSGGELSEEADDDEGVRMSSARALSPGERAVDLAAGFSFSARRMGFVYAGDIIQTSRPPRYRGTPVPGFLLDATIYPLAFGHKREGMAKNVGLTLLYDRVLLVSSQAPGMNGMPGAKLDSAQQRYALGISFRYPFNKTATSPVVGANLRYGRQKFTIDGDAGIPNVNYTIIDPMVFFKYPISTKLALGVNLGYMLVSDTGGIGSMMQYGPTTANGFEGEIGGDFLITKNVFLRAAFKFETIGMTFAPGGMKTNVDGDPEQDVFGARDTYLGGMITAGYAL